MENLGIGEWIVIGLSLVIFLFFIIGNWSNNQRGLRVMRWLKRGLSTYGEVGLGRFSAPTSKGIQLRIETPKGSPFKTFDANLILERRENLPLWAFQLLRGKKDRVQITAELESVPKDEVHVFHQSNLAPVEAARRGEKAALNPLRENGEYSCFSRGEPSLILADRIVNWIGQYPGLVLAVSVQKKAPHLGMELRLSQLLELDAEKFFRSIQADIL